MKTAIFIEENRQQVVLTPENEWERNILKTLSEKKAELNMHYAQFNRVQGGWTIHDKANYRGEDKDSLIIVLDQPTHEKH